MSREAAVWFEPRLWPVDDLWNLFRAWSNLVRNLALRREVGKSVGQSGRLKALPLRCRPIRGSRTVTRQAAQAPCRNTMLVKEFTSAAGLRRCKATRS
jgi:hypothetical protein